MGCVGPEPSEHRSHLAATGGGIRWKTTAKVFVVRRLGPKLPGSHSRGRTPNGSGEGNEAQTTHQVELTALWVMHDLFGTPKCWRWMERREREAGYRCAGCPWDILVRCLRQLRDGSQAQRRQNGHCPYRDWCGATARNRPASPHLPIVDLAHWLRIL